MCGIAGFIDGRLNNNIRAALLESMLVNIAHRGPDARGTYFDGPVALGHNRLSIIDLSAEGNQPMHRGHLHIVYNGEVYNYREIRTQLEAEGVTFHSHSDTEVILASYEKYGPECVKLFMGMWAFVIWDDKSKTLFCSRDRFGIKPFFYIREGDRFYFGSEYKVFFPAPVFRKDINLSQVFRGLQMGWNAWHDDTYYDCIKSLPPAHNMLVGSDGSVSVSRYWDIDTERENRMDYREAKDEFRRLFLDSVRLHMRSDVEVGACLSGGIDSSAIASVVGKEFSGTRFRTFTVYYEGKDEVDERPWVAEVLKAYPGLEPSYFSPTDDEIAASFEKAIWHADVPLAGSSPISQYFVMQLAASKGIKVLLDGQGSDEMLAGYMHSFYRLMGGYLGKMKIASAFRELAAHSSRQGFGMKKKADLFAKSVLAGIRSEQDLYEFEYLHYFPLLAKDKKVPFRLADKGGSRLNQFLYQLTTATSLPTLLQFEDRNSMAFSIESRVPFLDHRIAEFAFSLPDSAKMHDGVTKRILRESLPGYLPEAIAGRKDKKGFVTPGEVKWLRGPLRFLLEQDTRRLDFLDRNKVNEVLEGFKKGDNRNANLVWRLVVLNYWLKN